MDKAIQELRLDAQAAFISRRQQEAERGTDFKTVALTAIPEFESMWASTQRRIELVPPKTALAVIARGALRLGGRPVSDRSVSAAMRSVEVDEEVSQIMLDIEYELNSSTSPLQIGET
jgi:hypothetical protein